MPEFDPIVYPEWLIQEQVVDEGLFEFHGLYLIQLKSPILDLSPALYRSQQVAGQWKLLLEPETVCVFYLQRLPALCLQYDLKSIQ